MTCADYDRHELLLLGCTHQQDPMVLITFTDGCTGQVCAGCDRDLGMKRQPDLAERIAGPAGGLDMLVLLRATVHDNRGEIMTTDHTAAGYPADDPGVNMPPQAEYVASLARAVAQRDAVYRERDALVAALSKVFPAHLARHEPPDGWDPEWLNIVCVHLPTGQVRWHVAADELGMFAHLGVIETDDWDGHDTPEKYRRLNALAAQHPPAPEPGRMP